jgi:hypothetical protein
MAKRKKLDPSKLPGTFESRIFIGGSYKAAAAAGLAPRQMLEELKKVVLAEGLHAMVADEYEVAEWERDIHHDAMFLLHSCRCAIFELSEFSGAMMEIERSVDFATRCIVLHHDPNGVGWKLSWMLSSFAQQHSDRIRLYGYGSVADARSAARNWLKEMLRSKYARK